MARFVFTNAREESYTQYADTYEAALALRTRFLDLAGIDSEGLRKAGEGAWFNPRTGGSYNVHRT